MAKAAGKRLLPPPSTGAALLDFTVPANPWVAPLARAA